MRFGARVTLEIERGNVRIDKHPVTFAWCHLLYLVDEGRERTPRSRPKSQVHSTTDTACERHFSYRASHVASARAGAILPVILPVKALRCSAHSLRSPPSFLSST